MLTPRIFSRPHACPQTRHSGTQHNLCKWLRTKLDACWSFVLPTPARWLPWPGYGPIKCTVPKSPKSYNTQLLTLSTSQINVRDSAYYLIMNAVLGFVCWIVATRGALSPGVMQSPGLFDIGRCRELVLLYINS